MAPPKELDRILGSVEFGHAGYLAASPDSSGQGTRTIAKSQEQGFLSPTICRYQVRQDEEERPTILTTFVVRRPWPG